jgi:hypothetical protein
VRDLVVNVERQVLALLGPRCARLTVEVERAAHRANVQQLRDDEKYRRQLMDAQSSRSRLTATPRSGGIAELPRLHARKILAVPPTGDGLVPRGRRDRRFDLPDRGY